MEKYLFNKISTITSTLFDSLVGVYQVCDKDESDEYFKHNLVFVFKDRKPYTLYGIKNKGIREMLDDISFIYESYNKKEETTEE